MNVTAAEAAKGRVPLIREKVLYKYSIYTQEGDVDRDVRFIIYNDSTRLQTERGYRLIIIFRLEKKKKSNKR